LRKVYPPPKGVIDLILEEEIIGESANIKRVRELIRHVADTGLNTIIIGETGVGKELVAQCLYQYSLRRYHPFIKVNCAAIPESLLESELFGYERGAFTGADRNKKGKFQLAHNGVLFLDEIGDMSLSLQSKLLHVLQSGDFSPLGSEKIFTTNTWVITATNQDLQQALKNKTFREDLYYRLHIINVKLEPLRTRPEDIPCLIEHFIKKYSSIFPNKKVVFPNESVMDRLMTYHWPGNVRELQNIIQKKMALGSWDEALRGLIFKNDTPHVSAIAKLRAEDSSDIEALLSLLTLSIEDLSSFSLQKIKKEVTDRIENRIISLVLEHTGWNRSKAAKILKISYKTLLFKIRDLAISPRLS
jgi:two-component system response regulator AtoC